MKLPPKRNLHTIEAAPIQSNTTLCNETLTGYEDDCAWEDATGCIGNTTGGKDKAYALRIPARHAIRIEATSAISPLARLHMVTDCAAAPQIGLGTVSHAPAEEDGNNMRATLTYTNSTGETHSASVPNSATQTLQSYDFRVTYTAFE